jgi:hypothetical protein
MGSYDINPPIPQSQGVGNYGFPNQQLSVPSLNTFDSSKISIPSAAPSTPAPSFMEQASPYLGAVSSVAGVLSLGYNIYNSEKARRAQARTLRREIERQTAIRNAEIAEDQKWKQIQYQAGLEEKNFSRQEYNKVKRIEYFQRMKDNVVNAAQRDLALKELMMKRMGL